MGWMLRGGKGGMGGIWGVDDRNSLIGKMLKMPVHEDGEQC